MAQAKKITKASKIKKKWYSIIAPKLFREQKVGETLVGEPDKAIGKTVPVNLLDLTGDMRKQNIIVKFVVNSVSGDKAHTEVIGYEIMPSFIKRMIRRGKHKIDHSFVFETADNKKVKVKIVLLTLALVKQSIRTALRKRSEENLARMVKKLNFEALIGELVAHKIQNDLKKQLNKIYPLRVCEIRYFGLEKEKKPVEEEKVKEKPKKEVKKVEKKEKQVEEKKEADAQKSKISGTTESGKTKKEVKEEKKVEKKEVKKETVKEEKVEEKEEVSKK